MGFLSLSGDRIAASKSRMSVAGATFSPKSISGLALWLDASDASTLFQNSDGTVPATATSDPVGYWGDKSGNGRHAVQATTGNRPLVGAVVANGRRGVNFGTTNNSQKLSWVPASGTQDWQEVFAVGVYDTSASTFGDNHTLFGGTTSALSDIGWQGEQSTNSLSYTYGTLARRSNINAVEAIDTSLVKPFPAITSPFLVVTRNTNNTLANGFQVGNDRTVANRNWRGRVCEVVAFSRTLTATERSRIARYLASKYGITLAPTVSNADAQDWVNRVYANGGTVSASTAAAVSAFCDAIDYGVSGASIRDRFYRLNLFCGGTSGTAVGLNSALVPLYRGPSLGGTQYGNTTDINSGGLFAGADYSESAGLTGNGSTGNKFLNPGTCATLKPSWVTHHFGMDISGAFPDATNRYLMGAFFNETPTSPRGSYAINGYNTSIRVDSGMPNRGAYTTASNLKWAIRSSASDLRAYEDNTQSGSTQNATDTASVLPGGAFAIMSSSYQNVSAGTPTNIVNGYAHSVGTCRGYTIGEAMDATQRSAFVSAWIAFQQVMGRR